MSFSLLPCGRFWSHSNSTLIHDSGGPTECPYLAVRTALRGVPPPPPSTRQPMTLVHESPLILVLYSSTYSRCVPPSTLTLLTTPVVRLTRLPLPIIRLLSWDLLGVNVLRPTRPLLPDPLTCHLHPPFGLPTPRVSLPSSFELFFKVNLR